LALLTFPHFNKKNVRLKSCFFQQNFFRLILGHFRLLVKNTKYFIPHFRIYFKKYFTAGIIFN